MAAIRIKRVYAEPEPTDGIRILVDRLWPRGLSKDKAQVDLWLKEIAPSDALRKRFHGKPDAWEEFRAAYAAELKRAEEQEAAKDLKAKIAHGPVTLLYASRDEHHNNAVALKAWLERKQMSAAVLAPGC
jgi:uncharacterized protein YeaO (DUF488 family)